MPSSVTILCQIQSKGLDGGFINGLANYMTEAGESKTLHYGFYKNQISLFLYDLKVGDHALLCGKCVFNRGNMYILVSAAFRISIPKNHENDSYATGPYASFVGRIYEKVEQNGEDCKFGVNLLEYNNFNFGNKEKMEFKIQVVYGAGPKSRFRRLTPSIQVGKLIFISGFFDLNENESPFIEAMEMDILDEFSNNNSKSQSNINIQSPLSRAHKFRSNKKTSNIKEIEIINDNVNERRDKSEEELEIASTSTAKVKIEPSTLKKQTKKTGSKRKMVESAPKNTKVKTRSQRQKELEPVQKSDDISSEAEKSI